MSRIISYTIGLSSEKTTGPVRVGDTVAVMDGGREIARVKTKVAPAAVEWSWKDHLARLEEIFPEPVHGVDEIMEDPHQDICER